MSSKVIAIMPVRNEDKHEDPPCPTGPGGFFVARRNWAKTEENWLCQYYAISSREQLVQMLERSWKSICNKVHQMGLKRNIALTRQCFKSKTDREWNKQEVDFLRKEYWSAPRNILEIQLHRKWAAIKAKASSLRLCRNKRQKKDHPQRWQPEEDQVLYQTYRDGAFLNIKQQLPRRSWSATRQRARQLGLERQHMIFQRELHMKKLLNDIYPTTEHIDNAKPEWLVNPKTGRRMELDRYYPELKLAFEYNGQQHYRPAPVFGNIKPEHAQREFKEQQERDKIKRQLCIRYSVILVVVEYSKSLTISNMKRIIRDAVKCQK